MKVENMTSSRGNKIANQFIITTEGHGSLGNFLLCETFQSYNTVWPDLTRVEIDKNYWDYSVTTGKYRNIFLGETKKETERKIKDGTYILTDLNG